MYQYLTDFHGKSQLFRFFALKSMWLRFFFKPTCASIYHFIASFGSNGMAP